MKSAYLIRQVFGTVVFFSLIFVGAGRLDYSQGIVYLSIGVLMLILQYTIFRIAPDLLAERASPGKGTPTWDKRILLLSFLVTLVMYATAGLDSGRFHWSPPFHWGAVLLGIILTVAGQTIFMLAQKQNKFFSSTMRIQPERNHQVCDTGLYSRLRHPAYLGSLIQAMGFPLLMESLWSIIPATALICLLIVRTQLEDKALQDGLPGYSDYTLRVKYRLLKGVF